MVILDTNVISELMKPEPALQVILWLKQQNSATLFLTTITLAEIHRGLNRLPHGKKKKLLSHRFELFVTLAFSQRILSFDTAAAAIYGLVTKQREAAGLHVDAVDMMIAAIAAERGFAVATRNIKDLKSSGIKLLNPWDPLDNLSQSTTRHG